MSTKVVTYCRVSTTKQGQSGLGLQAQQDALRRYLSAGTHTVVGEFQEVETGKGSNALSRRPQLAAALDTCKRTGATLVIAKLDRLARNVAFIAGLMESRVRFIACDMPEANELTIHIMAAFAEHEAKRISQRTRDALAVAKARGVKLGVTGPENLNRCLTQRRKAADDCAARLAGLVAGFAARRLSQRKMVTELNEAGVPAPRGGTWSLAQVQRLIRRVDSLHAAERQDRQLGDQLAASSLTCSSAS